MAGYSEGAVIISAGDIDDDLESSVFTSPGDGRAQTFGITWTDVDTPTGTLAIMETTDGGSTFSIAEIPSDAVNAADSASRSTDGTLAIAGGGSVTLRLIFMPKRYKWVYTHGLTGTGDTMTIREL